VCLCFTPPIARTGANTAVPQAIWPRRGSLSSLLGETPGRKLRTGPPHLRKLGRLRRRRQALASESETNTKYGVATGNYGDSFWGHASIGNPRESRKGTLISFRHGIFMLDVAGWENSPFGRMVGRESSAALECSRLQKFSRKAACSQSRKSLVCDVVAVATSGARGERGSRGFCPSRITRQPKGGLASATLSRL
jgi:hypothetical protein